MSLKRILKLLISFLTGQGVTVVTQLIIPPLFIQRYIHGVEVYGEWITLSAAVSYLSTLNYGIQTYANNQMTIHFNRGEMEEGKVVQASAIRLLLLAVTIPLVGGASLLAMPVGSWLRLRFVSSTDASLTIFLLVLQLVSNWALALLTNSYMAIGEAHRGANWVSAQRFVAVFVMAVFLLRRASFPVLALTGFLVMALFLVAVTIDVRIRAPILLPAWRYGSWGRALSMVKPSGWFVILGLSGFLVWQGPLLLIQRILGPTAVAVFALSRMTFSMSRQMIAILSYSIGQEITHLVGQRAWVQLRRLYELSEKIVLLSIPTTTIGVLLVSPVLFAVWLHKRSIYSPGICIGMSMISAIIGIKEHKHQFQWSSNEHTSEAKFTAFSYCVMLVISATLLKPFGLEALLACWAITEIAQVIYILHLNTKLFPPEVAISAKPVMRLTAVLAVSFALVAWPCWHDSNWTSIKIIVTAVVLTGVVGLSCYFVFDLREVLNIFQAKLRKRTVLAG